MQIIVTRELKSEDNPWLGSLTDNLNDEAAAERILVTCRGHLKEEEYQSYIDVVMKANVDLFMEVMKMNRLDESLLELMYEKGLDKKIEQRGKEKGLEEGLERGKILGSVETLLKLSYDEADIIKSITTDYDVSKDEAIKIIEEVQKQLNKAS